MTEKSHLATIAYALGLLAAASAPVGAQDLAVGKVLRLPSGDSVEFVTTGPILFGDGTRGVVVQYHPFVPVEESPRLTSIATQLWRWLRPHIDSNPPPVVVLMATTGRAHSGPGVRLLHNFNHVIEHRADGNW